jgi:hypothetical protein
MPVMNVYISHSRSFDFRHLLYEPLLESIIATNHHLILPLHDSDSTYPLEKNLSKIDLIAAEVSYPSTEQGLELGLAHANRTPIIYFYKNGSSPSQALSQISHINFAYIRSEDMIRQLAEKIK